jgi:hypothetical protein
VVWLRVPLVLLLCAGAVVFALGYDRGPGEPVATKYGSTTQGRAFELRLDADGRPVSFDTTLSARCPDGRTITMPWAPVDGDGVVFRRDGERLRVKESGDGWKLSMDATVAGSGALRGVAELSLHLTPRKHAPVDCASPQVRVTAGS